jgi:hypothetical protein
MTIEQLTERAERAERRLRLIEEMVSGDTAMDAECTVFFDKGVTEKEKEYGGLITRLYTYTHPFFGHCGNGHEDWEKEAADAEANLNPDKP